MSQAAVGISAVRCTTNRLAFIRTRPEQHLVNLIVRRRWHERYYSTIRNSLLMSVEGTVQRQGRLINVLALGAVAI